MSPEPQAVQDPQSNQWLDVLPESICCVILGAPGTGKSALGHYLLELFRFKQAPYILGFPEDHRISTRFEQPELKPLMKGAKEAFQELSADDKKFCYSFLALHKRNKKK